MYFLHEENTMKCAKSTNCFYIIYNSHLFVVIVRDNQNMSDVDETSSKDFPLK